MASLKDTFANAAKGEKNLGFDPMGNDEARLSTLRLDDIEPDPNQPRKTIGDIEELKSSIQQHGILQPLIVSPLDGSRYRLIAGERRYTAAKALNLRNVPALVRTVNDHHRLELQLIENLHRKDLDPFEEAVGYLRLSDEFGLTHEDVARQIGKSRSYITQMFSLAKIPDAIRTECLNAETRIARDTLYLIAKQESFDQMMEVLAMAKGKVPIGERRERARKGEPRTDSKKPKLVYQTEHDATVIVQSLTTSLNQAQVIKALKEALKTANSQS